MTTFQFKKASKIQAKLRAALFGPSGSGKTFSALRIATGLGGSIAVIDTEHGSASKYADRFAFDTLSLDVADIANVCAGIHAAGQAGYAVLVIDSLSHAWQELLEEVDRLAKAKYRGNTWSAWCDGTPMQKKLVRAILSYPGHVLATMRSKTEWTTTENNGKKTPQRVGLAPEQGKGVEYEFDLLLEISPDHIAQVIKDRTGKFQDKMLDKPGEDFGKALAAWLSEGEPVAETPTSPTAETPPEGHAEKAQQIAAAAFEHGVDLNPVLDKAGVGSVAALAPAQLAATEKWLAGKIKTIQDAQRESQPTEEEK